MIKKYKKYVDRYNELNILLSQPNIINNNIEFKKLMKEHSFIEKIVNLLNEYNRIEQKKNENLKLLENEENNEMICFIQDEVEKNKNDLNNIKREIDKLMNPKNPNDNKNIIMEIRAGAGGNEAGLFVGSLFRMYTMYAERHGYTIELLNSNAQDLGGFRDVVVSIKGKDAYKTFKHEVGVHRVQRVPDTESSGRVHTSTATVAVLPEIDDVEININKEDIRIDRFRSSGAGGQHVNVTDSAVRITHFPSGIVVSCQDGRDQHQNKKQAMSVLQSKLYELKEKEIADKVAKDRGEQVGTGDRAERIRTYNYPQGRVTDHRINKTIYQLDNFLNGDIQEMIDALQK